MIWRLYSMAWPVYFAVFLVLVTTVGCGGDDSINPELEAARDPFPASEAMLEEIAKASPGFGGYYIDRDADQIVIWLIDADQRAIVESRIIGAFGGDVIPDGGTQIQQGRYGFDELKEWQRKLDTRVWNRSVTYMGIAYDLNRIRITVYGEAAKSGVLADIKAEGVPEEAVVIWVTNQSGPAWDPDSLVARGPCVVSPFCLPASERYSTAGPEVQPP